MSDKKECNHDYEIKEEKSDLTSIYIYYECKHCGRPRFEVTKKK